MISGRETADDLQFLASNPQGSVWVSANAGSGKTHVLVNRVVRLLLNGTAPERILCLTYTKAAAAEMSNRLFDELAGWIALDDDALIDRIHNHTGHALFDKRDHANARRLFIRALEAPGGLKIQTIHAFCERLLQRFPVEAGVVPGFEVMDDETARELRQKSASAVLATAKVSPDSQMAMQISVLAAQTTPDTFDNLIRQFIDKRRMMLPLVASDKSLERAATALHRVLGTDEKAAGHSIADDCIEALDTTAYRKAAEMLGARATKTDQRQASLIKDLLEAGTSEYKFGILKALFLKADGMPKAGTSILTKRATEDNPETGAYLLREGDRIAAAMDHIKAVRVHRATMALLILGAQILKAYETAKRQAGLYDYDDLILRTLDLLEDSDSSLWVLYKLDGGLDHILLDEAQDTSPEQWRIIEQLSAEFFAGQGARTDVERTIFAVGDRKQSIYSFQGADPDEFDRMRQHFGSHAANAGQELSEAPLQVSFRSTPEILEVVEKVFSQPAAAAGLALPGVGVDGHKPNRARQCGRVEMWALEEPEDTDAGDLWSAPDSENGGTHPRLKLAARIASTIDRWVSMGADLTPRGRPMRYGDILILVRNRTTFADAIVRALKKRGIPVAGADRLRLTRHIAVQDLMSLMQFVLLPQDDLSLAEVLKSPLVARDNGQPIDDDDLFDLAHDRGAASLWEALHDAVARKAPYSAALKDLQTWRGRAGFETPYGFLSRVLTGDSRRKAMLERLGTEAAEPLDALLTEALNFEQSHSPDLNGFWAWLEGSDIQIKRDMDHSGDEVRVMTVHGAKGLEANVVILPDTNNAPDKSKVPAILVNEDDREPPLPVWRIRADAATDVTSELVEAYLRRMQEEENRLLYVAMTRARDRLYICGYADKGGKAKPDSWYQLVANVMQQDAYVVPGETALWRIEGKQREAAKDTAAAEADSFSPQPPPNWAHAPAPREDAAMKWFVASKLSGAEEQDQSLPPEQALSPLAGEDKNRFARGNLIHRLLQMLPDLPGDQRQRAAEIYLKLPGHNLERAQIEDIRSEVTAILDNQVFAPVFGPGSRAEVPLTAIIDTGAGPVSLTGQIDRLVVTENEILIVDYKTNRPPPARIEDADLAYVRQLAAYRAALSTIYPDKPVRAALLWTNTATLMEVPTGLLEAQVPLRAGVT